MRITIRKREGIRGTRWYLDYYWGGKRWRYPVSDTKKIAEEIRARIQVQAAEGTFKGASGHKTSGTVTIEQDGDGYIAILQSNFNFDGAPDPKLGFGKNGSYDGSSKIAHLGKLNGLQVYKIPAGIDVGAYNEFYVWCEKYSVPLGVAKLQ